MPRSTSQTNHKRKGKRLDGMYLPKPCYKQNKQPQLRYNSEAF